MLRKNSPLVRSILLLSLAALPLPTAHATLQTEGKSSWTAGRIISDQQIQYTVDHAFQRDCSIPGNRIDVAVKGGVLTLSGTIENGYSGQRAVDVARGIRGVKSVADDLTVDPASESDTAIRTDIFATLKSDPASRHYEVVPMVRHGVVTLEGRVKTWQQKQLALAKVGRVRGVRRIVDEISVNYDTERPDSEIVAEAKKVIHADAWLAGAPISISVKKHVVTLQGSVSSDAAKWRAIDDAHVAGSSLVHSGGLAVLPQAEKTAEPVGHANAAAVTETLLYNPRTRTFAPEVSVAHGVVTLSGVVTNLKAKRSAAQSAETIVGVQRVVNDLKVQPGTPRTDGWITKKVVAALKRDPFSSDDDISVATRHGKVTLSGNIPTAFLKSFADDVASRTSGVLSVRNELDVSYPRAFAFNTRFNPQSAYRPFYRTAAPSSVAESDQQIQKDIENQLFWRPFGRGTAVGVSVENHVARLTGRVASAVQFARAGEAAYEAGAWKVHNGIAIGISGGRS